MRGMSKNIYEIQDKALIIRNTSTHSLYSLYKVTTLRKVT